jgi:tRNA threonylcarbamoyladenosine biosynthesis protein TsaE
MRIVETNSPEETWALAAELAEELGPGTVMALHGDLGAGKTCFVQGLAAALGIDEPITSPTYTLIGEYEGRLPLHHIDLYRLSGPEEALGLGIEEYFDANGITAIEWAERAEGLLPPDLIHIQITADEKTETRTFRIFKEDEV